MLNLTTPLLFSAKYHFSPPPVKKKSDGEREYLRLDEINAMMKVARKVGRLIWDIKIFITPFVIQIYLPKDLNLFGKISDESCL